MDDDDTEPPMDGPGEESQHSSDAGEPRLLESSHRALDATGGFVNPSDLHALRVVSKTASDSRVLVATKRVVTQRWTACAASGGGADRAAPSNPSPRVPTLNLATDQKNSSRPFRRIADSHSDAGAFALPPAGHLDPT